jgi:NTE family protein
MNRNGSNLASYLLFEAPFTRALMELGYGDTMSRRDEMLAFLRRGAEGATSAPA